MNTDIANTVFQVLTIAVLGLFTAVELVNLLARTVA
jgi:hypothetical protein